MMKSYVSAAGWVAGAAALVAAASFGLPLLFSAALSAHQSCKDAVGDGWLCAAVPNGAGGEAYAALTVQVFSGFMAAMTAVAVTLLAAAEQRRQELARKVDAAQAAMRLVAADVSNFADQLGTIRRQMSVVQPASGPSFVSADHGRLLAILPPSGIYESVAAHIMFVDSELSRALAKFYSQCRRVRAECAGATPALGTHTFVYLVTDAARVLRMALEETAKSGGHGAARSFYSEEQLRIFYGILAWLQSPEFQGPRFDGAKLPLGGVGIADERPPVKEIRAWVCLLEDPRYAKVLMG